MDESGYLVLSRNTDEKVIITVPASNVEQRIEIWVVEVKPQYAHTRKTRLGFKANPSIVINRKEVQDAIDRLE